MNKIGILRKFDKLGRLVVPKELRDRYKLNGEVEVIATKDGILLRNKEYYLVKRDSKK